MYCIETKNLTHRFRGGELALDGISLQVREGSIYGFLGANGAGKTTTLKLVLGLLKKQSGEISVFGRAFEQDRIAILRRIGSMIESPSIYGHLTARENLRLLQKVYGCPASRIAEVLELVGLNDTGGKPAGRFSLGMKQRLSIAIALLHRPTLLVLDEPTNGLDPNGILQMRELLKTLNREHGTTILISSHLLPEIEKLATHAGIIHRGQMLFQGTLPELVARQRENSFTVFETNEPERTQRIMHECGFDSRINDANQVAAPLLEDGQTALVNRRLVQSGVEVYRIGKMESDLEEIFFDVISQKSK